MYSAGVNWLALREDAWPALLLELNGDFVADSGDSSPQVAGMQYALTTYRTIDPLVLSLTLSYQQRRVPGREAGYAISQTATGIRSQVSFAVNPQVTLFTGLGLEIPQSHGPAAVRIPGPRHTIDMSAGFAFAPNRRHTVFVRGHWGSALGAAGLGVQWFLQF